MMRLRHVCVKTESCVLTKARRGLGVPAELRCEKRAARRTPESGSPGGPLLRPLPGCQYTPQSVSTKKALF